MSALFGATSIPVLEQVVNFAQARHGVLAGNIVNMDTPGYKARDLPVGEFQTRLKQAVEQSRAATPVSPGEPGFETWTPVAEVAKNVKTIVRHDQNSVSPEQQVSEMVKNQMEHNLALSILVQQFRLLSTAISGRV